MTKKQEAEIAALDRAAWLCNEWGEMTARAKFLGASKMVRKQWEKNAASGAVSGVA